MLVASFIAKHEGTQMQLGALKPVLSKELSRVHLPLLLSGLLELLILEFRSSVESKQGNLWFQHISTQGLAVRLASSIEAFWAIQGVRWQVLLLLGHSGADTNVDAPQSALDSVGSQMPELFVSLVSRICKLVSSQILQAIF